MHGGCGSCEEIGNLYVLEIKGQYKYTKHMWKYTQNLL